MEFQEFITAFETHFKTYIDIKKSRGDLTDIDPKDIIDRSNSFRQRVSYSMPKCTSEEKQQFDHAKEEMENILNNYIDERVKIVIKSMNKNS